MSLLRQLVAGVSLLFFVLLACVLWIYVANSRAQIEAQLAGQAQEAATALALRLSGLNGLDDRVLVEATVSPVFDRGSFREIRVVSMRGDAIAQRTQPPVHREVPDWFVRMFPLDAPGAHAIVTAGWRELARVVVASHATFAYEQLWRTFVQTVTAMLALYAAAVAAAVVFLHTLLRPLREIEQAAVAVGEREFRPIAAAPRARELARVVQAMNAMTEKIRAMTAEEAARAEALSRDAFMDSLTGLYNRRGFRRRLDALVESGRDIHSGGLALLDISGYAGFRAEAGFGRGEELLSQIGASITASMGGGGADCARLGESEFAFVATNIDAAGWQRMVESVCARVGEAIGRTGAGRLHYACGAVRCEGSLAEAAALLAAADRALQHARALGEDRYAIETL